MFDELVISSGQKKTNKSWTVVVSAIIQAGLLSILILLPLIYTEALPKQLLNTFLVAPAPPPPPPPPAAPVQRIVKPVARIIQQGKMMAPTVIPKKVAITTAGRLTVPITVKMRVASLFLLARFEW